MGLLGLDLFCGQGGGAAGYASTGGFDLIVGVDHIPQKHYPFRFKRADALAFLRKHGKHFDFIHASPPCQRLSPTYVLHDYYYPNLIAETREVLLEIGKPYVIENVTGARFHLRDPVMLCGLMFGLRTYRHRLFETNWPLDVPLHVEHEVNAAPLGYRGEFMHIVGQFPDADLGREIMQMPWATKAGLREAIPPAYTAHIGRKLLEYLASDEVIRRTARRSYTELARLCTPKRSAVRQRAVQRKIQRTSVMHSNGTAARYVSRATEPRSLPASRET